MTASEQIDAWIASTQAKRDEITAFSKTVIVNIDKAIDYSAEWTTMENKAIALLKIQLGIETKGARTKYPEATAKEREIYVRADMANLANFVADLSVVGQVLRHRIFNRNSSR